MGAGGGAALAGLGGFSSGIASGLELGGRMQERKQKQQLQQLQMQSLGQQQQAQRLAYGGLSGLGGLGGGPQAQQGGIPQVPTGGISPGGPQAPQIPSATGQMNAPLDLARQAMARGFPPAAAAGIAGSMTGESGRNLDPYALNPQSGALGMGQWLGPRKDALLQRPDPYSRETQTAHLFDELRGPESRTAQALMTENDPARASETFTRGFERPGNVDTSGRQKVAVQIYQQLTGGQGALGSPDEVIPAVQTARATEWGIPPAAQGQMSLQDMVRSIEQRAGPDTPDEVKFGALEMMQKYLQPQQKMAFDQAKEMYSRQWDAFTFGRGEADKAATRAESERYHRDEIGTRREAMERGAKQGYQILSDPQTQQQFMMIPGRPDTAQTLAGEPYKPQGAGKIGTAPAPGTPADDTVAKGIAQYQIAPLSSWAASRPGGQALMKRVLEINPQYNAPDYAARVSGTRAFAAGRQSDTVRSMGVVVEHLGTLTELGEALKSQDVRRINQVSNLVQKEFGFEGPVDFNAAKQIVGDEIAKAVIGGVNAEKDRAGLHESLDAASSPEQLAGVVNTFKHLIGGQLVGLRQQYKTATGKGDEDFDNLLTPRARKELGAMSKGGDKGSQSLDATPEQYEKLPPGAAYTVPGDPTVRYKAQ